MNRKILLISLLGIMSVNAFSQEQPDSVIFSIHYIAQFKNRVEDAEVRTEEKVLDVMNGHTEFYGRWQRKRDEIMDSVISAGGQFAEVQNAIAEYPRPRQFYSVQQNYPKKGERLLLDRIAIKKFYYIENIEPIKWNLEQGDTVVAGYQCQKASCDYRGRHWTAYYTTDIPFSVGPWNLAGLPGAIMYAKDDSGIFVFDGIEVRRGKRVFKGPNMAKAQQCSRDELRKMKQELDKDPDGFVKRLTGVKQNGYGPDGKPIIYKPKTTLFMEKY